MYRLGQCELIYIHQTKDSNYNPIIETKNQLIKCSLMDSFSVNYYQNQTRDIRNSKNIVIPKYHVMDKLIDGKRFQLEYVRFNGLKYKVTNILKDRTSSLKMILDCEEVVNE